MSDQYVGEIRMFAGNYEPDGWALCDGRLLSISDNQALFSLLGTTYGGDGTTNFALPDLRGRIPIHPSSTYPLAAKGGVETVQLTGDQLPVHSHVPNASSVAGTVAAPGGNVWAQSPFNSYSLGQGLTPVQMNATAIAAVGGSTPHDNMMPSLTISFIIALQGIYPTQG